MNRRIWKRGLQRNRRTPQGAGRGGQGFRGCACCVSKRAQLRLRHRRLYSQQGRHGIWHDERSPYGIAQCQGLYCRIMSTFSASAFLGLANDGLFTTSRRPYSNIPHGNLQHVFAQLAGLRAGADHCAHTTLLFGNFVQHLKSAGHVRVHTGCLLDFDGI